jgi:hypothetical protein
MQLQTTNPIKSNKKKKIKPSIPSDYAGYNYHNRMKYRRETIREICNNNFEIPNVVMLTLTYDSTKLTPTVCSNLEQSHYEFKKFVQRVNSHYENFRYLATFNRQSNGNWHYHVMCNFPRDISNNTIKDLWKNGIVYTTRIKSRTDYDSAVKYLIENMNAASSELKSKKGFLYAKSCERDIILDSWHADQEDAFAEAFEQVANANRTILYETRNHLGVKGHTVNEDTGEIAEFHLPDRELSPTLQQAGYESWDTIYTHLSSAADFSDKFAPLLPATPKSNKKNSTVKGK